ncbi:MAG: HAD family hydrolase [Oscillospiraceae bacterium]
MRDIRLIGLDLDNTVLTSTKQMTPRVQAAIKAAIAAGMVVLPATGRAFRGLPDAFLGIAGVGYAVTSNGAKVYRLSDGAVLLSDCFDKETALQVLDACLALGVRTASAFVDGMAYTEGLDFAALQEVYPVGLVEYLMATRKRVDDLRAFLVQSAEKVEKFSIVFEKPELRAQLVDVLALRRDCTLTASLGSNLEVNTPTANKGRALLALAESLGIAPAQVMAVGDGLNDREMVEMAGYGVAMENADPRVLAVADAVVPCSDEDGVALAIEQVLEA